MKLQFRFILLKFLLTPKKKKCQASVNSLKISLVIENNYFNFK